MFRQGDDLASVIPDQQRTPRKNKIRKSQNILVIRKEFIVGTVNPRKVSKGDAVTDVEKYSLHKTPPCFQHKVDYEDDTNKKIVALMIHRIKMMIV